MERHPSETTIVVSSTQPEPKTQTKTALFQVGYEDILMAFSEFVGTLIFVFLALTTVQAGLTVGTDRLLDMNPASILLIATSFGLAVMVGIICVGSNSGGHLNPAITLAFLCLGKIPLGRFLLYVIAQCLGSMTAAAFANVITPGPLVGYNALSQELSIGLTLFAEILLTFIFVLVVLTVVNSNMDSGFIPLMIGFALFAVHLSGITVDGTSVNPARSFGASVVSGKWNNHWVFWIGPLLGGILSSGVYMTLTSMQQHIKKE